MLMPIYVCYDEAMLDWLYALPLELFVLVGAFLEELVSPIPSVAVLLPAGALAAAKSTPEWYIVWLAVLAAVARVPAALILYFVAERLQERLFTGQRRRLGITKNEVTRFRKHLRGKRTWWVLFAMWGLPFFPGMATSLVSGFLKLPLGIFASATFAGSIVNALFYLFAGYWGTQALAVVLAVEQAGMIMLIVLSVLLFTWIWRRQLRRGR